MIWEPCPNGGTDGRHPGHSEPGLSHPRQLVDTAGHRAWARGARESWSTAGPRTFAGLTWNSWLTPRPLGMSYQGWIRPGQLVDHGPSNADRSTPGHLEDPSGPLPGHKSPRTAGQPCGSSDTGPSHAGQLVDTAGHQKRARFTREIWLKTRALGTGHKSPGTAGRSRRP